MLTKDKEILEQFLKRLTSWINKDKDKQEALLEFSSFIKKSFELCELLMWNTFCKSGPNNKMRITNINFLRKRFPKMSLDVIHP